MISADILSLEKTRFSMINMISKELTSSHFLQGFLRQHYVFVMLKTTTAKVISDFTFLKVTKEEGMKRFV